MMSKVGVLGRRAKANCLPLSWDVVLSSDVSEVAMEEWDIGVKGDYGLRCMAVICSSSKSHLGMAPPYGCQSSR